jgi:hypothetical protein
VLNFNGALTAGAAMLSHIGKSTVAIGAFAAIVLGMWISYPRVLPAQAAGSNDNESSLIKIGFDIAPVPLNLAGKNRALVGLGSFIVNAVAFCHHCHHADPSTGPSNEFLMGSNPYDGQQPAKINPATYLGGGNDFGPVGPPTNPDIISRNLTPDKTGLPVGGMTFSEFQQVMRTGKDFDNFHPPCLTLNPNTPPGCLAPPFDGNLLQIMPWPYFKNMPDRYISAIYEYLSTIPCIPGPANLPSKLQNVCS